MSPRGDAYPCLPRIAADDPRLSTARPWTLRPHEVATLELLADGALDPILGFVSDDFVDGIVRDGLLPDGTPFPVPAVLEVDATVSLGDTLALRTAEGVILALCERVRTGDARLSPGAPVARIAWGELSIVRAPRHADFPELRTTAVETKAAIESRDRGRVAAFFCDGTLSRALADRLVATLKPHGPHDALIVLVPAAMTEPGDLRHHLRIRTIEAALRHVDPAGSRTTLVLVPDPLPPSGAPADRVFALRRVLAAAYGAHALLGETRQCETARARETAAPRPGTWAWGASPVDLPPAGAAPTEHADVAALLARANPPRSKRGFTVWFTGLSQSGKSTIATILSRLLLDHGRGSTLLDGDVVRTHLSKGLGFSREDRDVNIRRLGFVASEITRHGGVAIVAAISPYRAIRAENRARIGDYVEVFVNAPITVCESRDQKGQYARARRGEISGFTGVDDPYEPPLPGDADHLECRTDSETPEQSARSVLAFLVRLGFVDPADRLDAIDTSATPSSEPVRD